MVTTFAHAKGQNPAYKSTPGRLFFGGDFLSSRAFAPMFQVVVPCSFACRLRASSLDGRGTNRPTATGEPYDVRQLREVRDRWRRRHDHAKSAGEVQHAAAGTDRATRPGTRNREPGRRGQGHHSRRRRRQLLWRVRFLRRTGTLRGDSGRGLRSRTGRAIRHEPVSELHPDIHGSLARVEADDHQGTWLLCRRRIGTGTMRRPGRRGRRRAVRYAVLPGLGLPPDGNVGLSARFGHGEVLRAHG